MASTRYTLGGTNIGDLEKDYVRRVLDDNFVGPGEVVQEVEKTLAEIHSYKHCVTLNSGQSALMVALQALKELEGCEVVAIPSCTYISTLAAAVYAGFEMELVDVNLDSNMNSSSLDNLLASKEVDVVIPVHLYGKPVDREIERVCRDYGVFVLEDGCEATCVPGTGWGTFLATSFFSNHLITGGSGGAVLTDNDDLDYYCWQMVNHGRQGRFGNNDLTRTSNKFRFDRWGHSLKWSDLAAAVAKAQLERRAVLYARRKQNASLLHSMLSRFPEIFELPLLDGHGFMMFPIVLSDDYDCGKVVREINEQGVETRQLMPITNQPVVLDYFKQTQEEMDAKFPLAARINRQGFYVGCHPDLSLGAMEAMGNLLLGAVGVA